MGSDVVEPGSGWPNVPQILIPTPALDPLTWFGFAHSLMHPPAHLIKIRHAEQINLVPPDSVSQKMHVGIYQPRQN
jgi:hypothetical protein